MSAGEVERLVELSGGTGGDEEEEWLYGGPWDVHVHSDLAKDLDENEVERPEEENASANPPSGIEEEAAENGVAKPKVTETEDDSDSDSDDDEDDVHVTIGDIKTGAPQYGSYGTAPVNLNIKAGGRVYGNTGTKVKGVDLDAPGSINGVPLLEVDLDSFEDKPWRKPGADLSDYFNYGFNEDTWKAYCEKQKRIRMGLEVIPVTSTTNKITVQQGRTGNSEKEAALPSTKAEFTSPPSLFKTGLPPSRDEKDYWRKAFWREKTKHSVEEIEVEVPVQYENGNGRLDMWLWDEEKSIGSRQKREPVITVQMVSRGKL